MPEIEQTPANMSERHDFLAELIRQALAASSSDSLLEWIVQGIREVLRSDFCEFLEYDSRDQSLVQRASSGWEGGSGGKNRLKVAPDSQAGFVLASDQPVVIDDLSQEERFHASSWLVEHGVRSGISLAVRGEEIVYGILGLFSRKKDHFSSQDVILLQTTANLLSGYLLRRSVETELRDLNANLEMQVEERTQLLRLLQEVTVMANETSSVSEAMLAFLNTVRSFTGWQLGHVLVVSEQENPDRPKASDLCLVSSSLWSQEMNRDFSNIMKARADTRLGFGQSLAGKAWELGTPVVVEDLTQQWIAGSDALLEAGLKAALAVPVFTGKQVAAVLEFFFEDSGSVTKDLINVLTNAGIELSRVIERRRSIDRLRESQLRIMEAQSMARLGNWEWTIASERVNWSPEMFRIFDLAEDEFEGNYQAFLEKIHPDDLDRVQTDFQRAYESGISFNVQHRIIVSNGEQRVLQNRGRVIRDRNENPLRIIGTVQDITEMVDIENRLRTQDELLQNVLDTSQIILWSIDRQGQVRFSRRGGLAVLDVPSGDRLGTNIFEAIPQGHPLMKYIKRAFNGSIVYVNYKAGERIFDLRILPQKDRQGELTAINGIAFDITQRIETEQALQQSEQSYRLVVDNVQDYAIFSLDRDGYVTSWNEGATRVKGYQAGEILGKHYSVFFTQEDQERGTPQKILQVALERGKYEAEGWRVRKDGTWYWANTLLNPFTDEKGALLGYTKVVRDFTSRREAEQALQESEKRFRSIFEFGAMGIALLDLNGQFLLTNPALQDMLGYQGQELLSQGIKSLSYPFDKDALMGIYAEIAAGKDSLVRKESRFQRKDHQILWASLSFSLVKDAEDEPSFVIGIFEDITYRKRMEAELRGIKRQMIISEEQQRLFLAQELHDDPMQELYGALFHLETLDMDADQGSALQLDLQSQIKLTKDTIEKVIQKLRVICGQLRPINLVPFGLEGAIREHMDRFLEEHPNLSVKLELTYDGQLLSEEVRISLFRIYQQAMGNIIRHSQAKNIVVRFYYDQQQASLEVEDDGVGFEVPASLFRLARQDHLGIAGAEERAELLGGRLIIRSAPGKGTLVRAEIPLTPFVDPAIHDPR